MTPVTLKATDEPRGPRGGRLKIRKQRRSFKGAMNPNWAGGTVSLTCEECGQPFQVPPQRGPVARFCSLSCTNVWQRRERPTLGVAKKPRHMIPCFVCGNAMELTTCQLDRKRTCSPECSRKLVRVRHLANRGNIYSSRKVGKREDLDGQFFRSSWEANYARYLNLLLRNGKILQWEYEEDTFWFEKIRRGVRSYTPDFKVTTEGGVYYVEIKGWMDPRSKTKIKRMAKYHPSIDLRVVAQKEYKALTREVAPFIEGWE